MKTSQRAESMGLDISNALFGNFHLNWAGTGWLETWCAKSGLPYPFIGWGSGDRCVLIAGSKHVKSAETWCRALEQKFPDLAQLGKGLTVYPPEDFWTYIHRDRESEESLSEDEWERRAVAAWYAILRHGITHGDTLEYL